MTKFGVAVVRGPLGVVPITRLKVGEGSTALHVVCHSNPPLVFEIKGKDCKYLMPARTTTTTLGIGGSNRLAIYETS